jgi:hypothetical protein
MNSVNLCLIWFHNDRNQKDFEESCLTISKTEKSTNDGFSLFPTPAINLIVIEIPETNGNNRISI